MPALVVALEVTEGQAVEGGKTLLVIEAMKMEHTLAAAAAARVRAVHVAAGAQVSAGQLLVELEPRARLVAEPAP